MEFFKNIDLFIFWSRHAAWGILVPLLGTEPMAPVVEARSLIHWTAREAPPTEFFKN